MKNNQKTSVEILTQNHGLSPLEKPNIPTPKWNSNKAVSFQLTKHTREKSTQNNWSMYSLTERPRNDQASWADNNIIYSHTFSLVIKENSFSWNEWINQWWSRDIFHQPHLPPCQKLFSDIIINFTKIKSDLLWGEMGYLNMIIMNVNVMWMILFTNMEQQSSRR